MSVTNFRDLLKRYGEENPPADRWDGADGRRGFLAWRRRFTAILKKLRNDLPRPPAQIEPLDVLDAGDHVRQRIRIHSVLDAQITAYVLIPKNLSAKAPGVLALHGHITGGKDPTAGVVPNARPEDPDDYGLASVRAGFITLCPDWWGWGERAEEGFDFKGRDFCDAKFMAAEMYGLSLLSVMISDGQAALDALLQRPEVDPKRVAVIGNSFGGRMSMWLAALDRRVGFAVCAGCLNSFRERSLKIGSCGAQYFPGLLRHGDVEDVFSLIAPRPLMITCGGRDELIDSAESVRMRPVIQRAYQVLGAGTLTFYDFDGGHHLPQDPATLWLADRFAGK